MIRVALAASSAMLLAGLEAVVNRDGAFIVVERVHPLQRLPATLAGADVDVVVAVVDHSTPAVGRLGDNGGGATPPWVVLADTDGDAVGEWLERGARAVLPRDAEEREILVAIEAVHAGLSVVPAASALQLAGAGPRLIRRPPTPGPVPSLSPREGEILSLLADGLGNKIVAARLGISEHTVKTHVASIFHKLGADTRAEAVAIGARSGLILL
ncbi:MAG: response regulator transcription factor [Gemmatimonadaceae bacterium]